MALAERLAARPAAVHLPVALGRLTVVQEGLAQPAAALPVQQVQEPALAAGRVVVRAND